LPTGRTRFCSPAYPPESWRDRHRVWRQGPPRQCPETPKDTGLAWDDYTDPDLAGYILYYALEAEPPPRTYSDSNRVNIGLISDERVTLKDVIPGIRGSMCFKITAYDLVGKESGMSNEACGWFGMGNPQGLVTTK